MTSTVQEQLFLIKRLYLQVNLESIILTEFLPKTY